MGVRRFEELIAWQSDTARFEGEHSPPAIASAETA
jgi:hypothetical protein